MDRRDDEADARDAGFEDYVERLVGVLGHADRAEPPMDYCTGLLLPVERKSGEPLVAATRPGRCRPSISRCFIL